MDLDLYLAFLLATAVLILIPGPNVTLLVANSLAHGPRRALITLAGTSSAIALQLVVVALGMTSLILVLAGWFEWLRWAGVAYLIWLGIQQWRAAPLALDDLAGTRGPLAHSVLAGRSGLGDQSQDAVVLRRVLPAVHRPGQPAGAAGRAAVRHVPGPRHRSRRYLRHPCRPAAPMAPYPGPGAAAQSPDRLVPDRRGARTCACPTPVISALAACTGWDAGAGRLYHDPPVELVAATDEKDARMDFDTAREPERAPTAWIIYDGQCPFCSRYVTLLRLRDTLGRVELVNAREGGPVVDEIFAAGLDLDEGMVLKIGDRLYHGEECIHRLALLSSSSTLFNRINRAIFRSPTLSRLLYPLLRSGRNGVLRLLGRSKFRAAA
jgi:predicted DCC family thiol-disulfide oxidoreductase YuxK